MAKSISEPFASTTGYGGGSTFVPRPRELISPTRPYASGTPDFTANVETLPPLPTPPTGLSVLDVAQYILAKAGEMTAMKLQKLVYYSQAWSLVWDDAPLFSDRIEAWANGPVSPRLYDAHRGRFKVAALAEGNPSRLSKKQRDTCDSVISFYGPRSSQWLSDLTHAEDPWRNARKSALLADGERGNVEIPLASMAEYYGGLEPTK